MLNQKFVQIFPHFLLSHIIKHAININKVLNYKERNPKSQFHADVFRNTKTTAFKKPGQTENPANPSKSKKTSNSQTRHKIKSNFNNTHHNDNSFFQHNIFPKTKPITVSDSVQLPPPNPPSNFKGNRGPKKQTETTNRQSKSRPEHLISELTQTSII